MTEERHEPRLFADDAAVRHIGEGLLACALRKEEWTHEAHLAACLWLLVERPDILPERDLPGLIRRFNESVGGVNDETAGLSRDDHPVLHRGVRVSRRGSIAALPLAAKVNGLLLAPEGGGTGRFASTARSGFFRSRHGWGGWSRLGPVSSLVIPAKAGMRNNERASSAYPLSSASNFGASGSTLRQEPVGAGDPDPRALSRVRAAARTRRCRRP